MGIGAYMGAEAMLSGINNLLGLGIGNYNREQNYYYGERQAENADKRTRALYADLYSPKALMKQYKDAGLSPSLMFGGTPGQGGTSGAMGSSVTMGNPYMPISMLEAAQIANIQAQTKKTEAEAKTITGENERGQAEIAKLWADKGYTEVSTALTAEQVTTQQWRNYITSETAESNINTAYSLAEQAANNAMKSTYEIISAQVKAHVDEATAEAQVEQAMQNVKYTEAQTLLAKSGIQLNEANTQRAIAEIDKWRQEIQIRWKELYNDMYKAGTERAMWRTMDEHMLRSMKVLEDRLSFDKDLGERKFLWTMVNDTYNNLLGTMNTVAPTKAK